jgi:iron complex outermembrane receptor protein
VAPLSGAVAAAWAFAYVLGVSSALVLAGAGPVVAQGDPDPSQAQATTSATFNIPAQSLASALTAFGRQAGLQVVFDSSAVAGKSTSGVVGTMTAEQALRHLLAGTGATFRFSTPSSITVTSANASDLTLDPVQVQGNIVPPQAMIDNVPPPYAGGQVGSGSQLGLLGNVDFMNAPFNVTSYTAKRIQDEQARSIRDVLADDPSVRNVWPSGSNSASTINIRGFDVSSADIAYGGLYGILPEWMVAPELAERVEVLKGPSTFLNGMPPTGAIGGTVNVVPKRATDAPITQFTASYVSGAQFGGAIDVGRRYGANKQFGVRFNGLYRNGETAIQWNNEALALGVFGIDFRGDNVRLSADFGYQDQRINALVSFPFILPGVPVPTAPTASKTFGQPWTWTQRKDLFGVMRGEVDITDGLTAYASFGAKDDRSMGLGVNQLLSGSTAALTTSPLTTSTFSMSQTVEAGLRGTAVTGPVTHALNMNVTSLWLQGGAGFTFGTGFPSNLYQPTFMPQPGLLIPVVPKSNDTNLTSIAFSDTLSAFNNRIQLMLGARQQFISSNNYDNRTGIWTDSYSESALSPAIGLVVKPLSNVSLYANYVEGLQQGIVVGPTFTNAGEVFPPYKSRQYEAGIKVDWGQFATTVSAFQISQPNAIADPVTNTLNVNGEQRNSGLEFNIFGEPIEGVRVLGGMMLINAVLTQTAGGLQNGWQAAGSPGFRLNLGGEWDVPFVRGLTLNSRVLYTSSQYVDVDYPRRSIPDWTRVDAGIRYTFDRADGKPLTVRFNVENLFNTSYWSAVGLGNFLIEGAPRTFLASLTANF